jgi:DNA repair protein RecO (recombination protein O)
VTISAQYTSVIQEEDEGILIHQMPYSETSRIITWLTKEHGIIRTLAKGVSRNKSSSFGVLDLFYHCQISYKLSTKSGLGTLLHSHLLKNHGQYLSSYSKQLSALYCYEVIESLVEKQTPVEEYYHLYLQALEYLETHETSWKLIERFERKALEFAGLNQAEASLPHLRHTAYHRTPKSFHMLKNVLDAIS